MKIVHHVPAQVFTMSPVRTQSAAMLVKTGEYKSKNT